MLDGGDLIHALYLAARLGFAARPDFQPEHGLEKPNFAAPPHGRRISPGKWSIRLDRKKQIAAL
jgi:hypothetical protein